MKKNVLITGSSGLIGGRLYKHLSKQNFNCVGLSRSKDKFKFLKYNKKNLSEKIKKANIVINCIGQDSNNSIDKKSAYVANSKIPETIYKLAKKNKIELFIHFSSFHVYKNAKVIHELSKIDNSNIHKKSKLHEYLRNNSQFIEGKTPIDYTYRSLPFLLGKIYPTSQNCRFPKRCISCIII